MNKKKINIAQIASNFKYIKLKKYNFQHLKVTKNITILYLDNFLSKKCIF